MTSEEEKIHFFSSNKEFRKWFMKNHTTKSSLWVGFYKKSYDQGLLQNSEAQDLCLCFGWVYGKLKSIDYQSYKIKFVKRKNKSIWSEKSIKRFNQLNKEKSIHSSGLMAFKNRNIKESGKIEFDWSPQFLKKFKSNKKAWDFFTSQSNSYQKYMKYWVMSAKRPETQNKRFSELIEDSNNLSKLKSVVAMSEKYKPQYEIGKTPIEVAKNIGAVTGAELRSVNITTLEKLEKLGWEEAFRSLCDNHPHRINMNMLTSLMGAIEKQNKKELDQNLRVEAKQFLRAFRREFEDTF
jgi:uncharacterized protein YdeI (YjbR/CyaY-like superfamily)